MPSKEHEKFALHPRWFLEIKLLKVLNELQVEYSQVQMISYLIVQVLCQYITFEIQTTSYLSVSMNLHAQDFLHSTQILHNEPNAQLSFQSHNLKHDFRCKSMSST